MLTTTGATVQLRVQSWSVNQQISIAKIRYKETSSENTAEGLPLWVAVTKQRLVNAD
jgi:hypothetical protein